MPDPFAASARFILSDYIQSMRNDVAALPGDALDWTPAGDDTNSVAVLVTHTLHSTRLWISIAVGSPLPERDRDSEFKARTDSVEDLLNAIDGLGGEILSLLNGAGEIDWGANRKDRLAPDPDLPGYIPAAYGLLHAVEHFSQHVGHVGLTRQLWEQRANTGTR